jgi:hypothetical protein
MYQTFLTNELDPLTTIEWSLIAGTHPFAQIAVLLFTCVGRELMRVLEIVKVH